MLLLLLQLLLLLLRGQVCNQQGHVAILGQRGLSCFEIAAAPPFDDIHACLVILRTCTLTYARHMQNECIAIHRLATTDKLTAQIWHAQHVAISTL